MSFLGDEFHRFGGGFNEIMSVKSMAHGGYGIHVSPPPPLPSSTLLPSLPLAGFRVHGLNSKLYCLLNLISQKLSPIMAQRLTLILAPTGLVAIQLSQLKD